MHIIYSWRDPRDLAIRYIGETDNAPVRYRSHLRGMEHSPKKNAWIKEMQRARLMPQFEIIDKAETRREAKLKEAFWIHLYAKRAQQGLCPYLTNAVYPTSILWSDCQYGQLELLLPKRDVSYLCDVLYRSSGNLLYADITEVYPCSSFDLVAISLNVYRDDCWELYTQRIAQRAFMDRSIVGYRTKLPCCQWATFGRDELSDAMSNAKEADEAWPE